MTTRMSPFRRVEEEIVNAGVPSQHNQAPPQEKFPIGCQAPINPPIMLDGEIRLDS